jgi:hypothetical protein
MCALSDKNFNSNATAEHVADSRVLEELRGLQRKCINSAYLIKEFRTVSVFRTLEGKLAL